MVALVQANLATKLLNAYTRPHMAAKRASRVLRVRVNRRFSPLPDFSSRSQRRVSVGTEVPVCVIMPAYRSGELHPSLLTTTLFLPP